ncbi:MAG: glutamine-hydrolyzing carbamoyl-phosphate synthase small subunit [Pseudomonadota bacterium]|nr:glutamine-hydrolyzing carbamoyl-phosphate synthase small subunit [Pseudomonadota bacterium]
MAQVVAALLALEDGSLFRGVSIGAPGTATGEVVFNTAMTGYQEILTDPSYARQMVTLTYPHIGNTGVNAEDAESRAVHAAGLIIRHPPPRTSSWRAQGGLSEYLVAEGCVAIANIDTRRLTRILREKGAQRGCILAGGALDGGAAVAMAQALPGLSGMDLAKEVTTSRSFEWREGSWRLGEGYAKGGAARFHVVVIDYGVKHNILRLLVDRGCRVTVVPAQSRTDEILALQPDGVLLSNGPGDPEPCDYAIETIRGLLAAEVPLFGICLGHQLLGLAAGGRTQKMKFGHHGANHPVKHLASGQVAITSQNHGFALDPDSLPPHLEVTHRSLFDGSIQGIRHRDKPAFGFQGHPEASPGPHDLRDLFADFLAAMAQ